MKTLPFDPAAVPVSQLEERYERTWKCVPEPAVSYRKAGTKRGSKPEEMALVLDLQAVDSEATVHDLQKADTRTTAAAHYERRVAELQAAAPEMTDEDRARGYRVTKWHGLPNYECILAPFSSLNEEEVQAFVKRHRRT